MLNKLIEFMGVKNEGLRRLTISSFLIPIIFSLVFLVEENIDDVVQIIMIFPMFLISWIFLIKIISWVTDGFKKNK